MKTTDLRRRLDRSLSEYQFACRQVSEEKQTLRTATERLGTAITAQKLTQEVAEQVQRQAHEQLANVVSHCLRAVFGKDAYSFKIDFRKSRGKTEARLCFIRDGQEFDPTSASGGGVVDVASLALRIACLTLSMPRRRKLIVADEPCRFVNGEQYQERVAELIESLARDFGIQFILVSDDPWLRLGKVIELG